MISDKTVFTARCDNNKCLEEYSQDVTYGGIRRFADILRGLGWYVKRDTCICPNCNKEGGRQNGKV